MKVALKRNLVFFKSLGRKSSLFFFKKKRKKKNFPQSRVIRPFFWTVDPINRDEMGERRLSYSSQKRGLEGVKWVDCIEPVAKSTI